MNKIIRKYLKTLKQAEKYRDKLYNKYSTVEAIGWPLFTEAGVYTFRVS